jgi:CBS domain-containing protein
MCVIRISSSARSDRQVQRSRCQGPRKGPLFFYDAAHGPLRSAGMTPSSSMVSHLRAELRAHAPFAQMAAADIDRFIAASTQAYFEPGEAVLSPAAGPITALHCIRRGRVSGRHGSADAQGGFEFEAGELFPIGAALAGRAVTATYTAAADTFCLLLPLDAMHALAAASAPFADFLNSRVQQFLDLSRKSLQVAYASQTLAEQSLETPLADLVRRAAFGVAPTTPIEVALRAMHERRIGSVLVIDDDGGRALGILTRHDVLGRITLPALPLSTPIAAVMSHPVATLGLQHTAQDAALLMSRRGIRHVPVTDADGRVIGIVSERDLFALQRLSLKQVSTAIRAAPDVATLGAVAGDIRRFARNLLGQGVRARQLTELISHLNDVLGERLVTLVAAAHGLDLGRACWLAFGSEGRSEQTIATDQDNGLVFDSADPARDRPAWLAFARAVNEALDACGYPLCKGNVMASNPDCCLTQAEWLARFTHWIDHGAPEDLLAASIYFDFRPLAGDARLVQPMRALVTTQAARNPRFMRQLADNALRNAPALNWHGGIDTKDEGAQAVIDLKLHGTAIYVDAARLYALAHGVAATGTRARFEAVAGAMGAPPQEAEAWVGGFEVLQMLRLQVQLERERREAVDAPDGNPNLVDVAALNDIDRRVLKESLRVARRLQQRIQLDYLR